MFDKKIVIYFRALYQAACILSFDNKLRRSELVYQSKIRGRNKNRSKKLGGLIPNYPHPMAQNFTFLFSEARNESDEKNSE